MRKLILSLLVVLLCSSIANAWVYRSIGSAWGVTGAVSSESDKLGQVMFTLHPYTLDARESVSVSPGTPLVAKLIVNKKAPNNPPVTVNDDVTILILAINSAGWFESYGTEDIPGIIPSNILRYDLNSKSWINDKFVANGNINEQMRYSVFVKYKDSSRLLSHTLNIR